jgi:hypothetical protein
VVNLVNLVRSTHSLLTLVLVNVLLVLVVQNLIQSVVDACYVVQVPTHQVAYNLVFLVEMI